MGKMEKTKYRGVRSRKHPTRTHGVKPDVCYFIRYTLHGKRHEEPFGWLSEKKTAELAFAKLTQIKQDIKDGKPVATLSEIREQDKRRRAEQAVAKEVAKKANVTFGQFFEDVYKVHRAPKALVPELPLYNYWIKPVIGDKTFGDITELDMKKIKREAEKERKVNKKVKGVVKTVTVAGKSLRTVEYCYSVVRMVFNEAKVHGVYHGDHPVTKSIRRGVRYDNRKTRFLAKEEAGVLLRALKVRSKKTHDMALLSLFCGLRAGEVLGLDWSDVNLKGKMLTLRDTKNGKTRMVSMPVQVLDMFSEFESGTGNVPVFVNAKGERFKKISKTFPRTVAELGLNKDVTDRRQKVSFHTLRHTFASWLAIAGTPLYTIQKWLGHSTVRMTERYSHLCPENFSQTAEVLSAIGKLGENQVEEKVINMQT